MKTLTLEVRKPEEATAKFIDGWHEGRAESATISFATPELLWTVLTAKRW